MRVSSRDAAKGCRRAGAHDLSARARDARRARGVPRGVDVGPCARRSRSHETRGAHGFGLPRREAALTRRPRRVAASRPRRRPRGARIASRSFRDASRRRAGRRATTIRAEARPLGCARCRLRGRDPTDPIRPRVPRRAGASANAENPPPTPPPTPPSTSSRSATIRWARRRSVGLASVGWKPRRWRLHASLSRRFEPRVPIPTRGSRSTAPTNTRRIPFVAWRHTRRFATLPPIARRRARRPRRTNRR